MHKFHRRDLISDGYLQQNQILHAAKEGYGGSGHKHIDAVLEFAELIGATSILDYGCGENTLRKKLHKRDWPGKVFEYDPARPKYSALPAPADLVVCTDVLEHIEPKKLRAVIDHLSSLARKGAYVVPATRPANKVLPDGRNAHLIIESHDWWAERLARPVWRIDRSRDVRKGGGADGTPHEARFWLLPVAQ